VNRRRNLDRHAPVTHFGDAPFAAAPAATLICALLGADIATMHVLIAGASNAAPALAWLLALTIPMALTAAAWRSAELLMRFLSERRPGALAGCIALGLAWLAMVIAGYVFRTETASLLSTSLADFGLGDLTSGPSDVDRALTLLLTTLLALTGAVAFASTALMHDTLQKRRRILARRVLLLRLRRRIVARRRLRAASAYALQIAEADASAERLADRLAHLQSAADTRKDEIRQRIAIAAHDPVATSTVLPFTATSAEVMAIPRSSG
jgi:hypothetical protein